MYDLYPQGEIQYGGDDDDVLVGDEDTVILPSFLEVIPTTRTAARSQKVLDIFWDWQNTRDTKNPPVVSHQKLLSLEPVAKVEDDGIELRIVLAVDKQLRGDDPQRAGTFIYKNLDTGKETTGGYWMDWPEDESLRGWAKYKALPKKTRANLELSNQLLWGFRHNYEFHAKTAAVPSLAFDEWVESKGGMENVMRLFGGTESFEWILSEVTDEVKEEYGVEDEEKNEEIIVERYDERVSEELARKFQDWMYKYKHLLQFPLRVYRAVTLSDVNSLETDGIGVYWTDSPSHAIAHWGQYEKGQTVYVIEGFVEEDAVDWDAMLEANMHPSLGDDEQEIRLKTGAKIVLDGYRKDVRSFGARGVFQPLVGEAVA